MLILKEQWYFFYSLIALAIFFKLSKNPRTIYSPKSSLNGSRWNIVLTGADIVFALSNVTIVSYNIWNGVSLNCEASDWKQTISWLNKHILHQIYKCEEKRWKKNINIRIDTLHQIYSMHNRNVLFLHICHPY